MRWLAVLGVFGVLAASGCAERDRAGVTLMQPPSSRELPSIDLGHAQVLDPHVDPMDGVRLVANEDAVVARFSPPRGPAEIDRLDPTSLKVLSQRRATGASEPAPPVEALRMVIDGGRHLITLWKGGDAQHGFRLMAQAFNTTDRSPRGAPVVVSPIAGDVAGPLNAVTLDDHYVVAGFAASTKDGSFAAYVVPLKAFSSSSHGRAPPSFLPGPPRTSNGP